MENCIRGTSQSVAAVTVARSGTATRDYIRLFVKSLKMLAGSFIDI